MSLQVELREEVAAENFTCVTEPPEDFDTELTHAAEWWYANVDFPSDKEAEARSLADIAGSNYSVTRHDEGLTSVAYSAPYPFTMRGFIFDRPVDAGDLEVPPCSEVVYTSTMPTETYVMSYPVLENDMLAWTWCDDPVVVGSQVQVTWALRCGLSFISGLAIVIGEEPSFSCIVRSMGDCGCGGQNDTDGDGILDQDDSDMDGDGIGNDHDPDTDGDGVPNGSDPDDDNDGIADDQDDSSTGPDESDDIDGDGVSNDEDDDIDGDGVPNDQDEDMDGDGVPNDEDLDDDADGETDLMEFIRALRDLINDFRDFVRQLV